VGREWLIEDIAGTGVIDSSLARLLFMPEMVVWLDGVVPKGNQPVRQAPESSGYKLFKKKGIINALARSIKNAHTRGTITKAR